MPGVKDKMTGKTVAEMSYDDKGMEAANKMAANDPNLIVTDGRMRSEQMYAGGGKTGYSKIGMEKPKMMYGGKMKKMKHGGKMKEMGHGGMMKKMGHGGMMKKYEEGGKALKKVDSSKNPGLSKLPKKVRNKMGYMEHGGKTKMPKMMYGGKMKKKMMHGGKMHMDSNMYMKHGGKAHAKKNK